LNLQLRGSKSLYAGATFIAIGIFTVTQAARYEFGTATRMGPGYFPICLGIVIFLLGAVTIVKAVIVGEVDPVEPWELAPLFLLLAGVVAFGLLIDRAGLVAATFGVVLLSCYARLRKRWLEILVMCLFLSTLAVGIFVYGLRLPFFAF
jgi:Tripartite tricarboxylate transporter TctB family